MAWTRAEEDAMWAAYRAAPTPANKARLVEFYQEYVKHLALKVAARAPVPLDIDDIISAGNSGPSSKHEGICRHGLMAAIDEYDPATHGTRFLTYASKRINGAMKDHLRSLDPNPRKVRQATNIRHAAADRHFVRTGRRPTGAELTRAVGSAVMAETGHLSTVSLSFSRSRRDSPSVGELDGCVLADTRTDPIRDAQRRSLREYLCRDLDREDRLILVLYYYERMKMREIGEVIGISESRVSQKHEALIERLKATVDPSELGCDR
jgi:RNA polymerase sigma factor for flagellar operon FliA